MVLDEHGFGHDGTGAARTGEPGDCRNQMQKKDGEIAHRTILARSRHAQEMPTNCEFAMHRSADAKYELTAHISVALAHPCLDFTDVKRH